MQISNIHESIIVMKSIDTLFLGMFLKTSKKKLATRVVSGLKPRGCTEWF